MTLIVQGVAETAARRQVAATFAGLAAQLQEDAPDFAALATRGGSTNSSSACWRKHASIPSAQASIASSSG
jgi:hypothetical protein